MSTPVEILNTLNHVRIASYATQSIPLVLFIAILVIMVVSKNRRNLTPIIIVCVLMVLSSTATIA